MALQCGLTHLAKPAFVDCVVGVAFKFKNPPFAYSPMDTASSRTPKAGRRIPNPNTGNYVFIGCKIGNYIFLSLFQCDV